MIRKEYVKGLSVAIWLLSLTIILIASLLPEEATINNIVSAKWSNFGHIPAYGVLSFSTVLLISRKVKLTRWIFIMVGISIFLFGLGIELLQPIFGRTLSLTDIHYNSIGIVISLAACGLLRSAFFFGTLDETAQE